MSDNGQPTTGLVPSASRRYAHQFFFQWEPRDEGPPWLHVYIGFIVNGQPVVVGEPLVLCFDQGGFDALAADFKRGGQSSPVKIAKGLPR